jgi:predicted acetyltransferase
MSVRFVGRISSTAGTLLYAGLISLSKNRWHERNATKLYVANKHYTFFTELQTTVKLRRNIICFMRNDRNFYRYVKKMIDQKQLDNVESLKYFGSILTNDGRSTCEIECRCAMAKTALKKKRDLGHIGHGIEKEVSEVLHLLRSFIWC